METITLSNLIKILGSVTTRRDYKRSGAFLDALIFTADNEGNLDLEYTDDTESWMTIDACAISEFSYLKFGHHLSSPRLNFIVTKLIIFYYNDILSKVETDIKEMIDELDVDKRDRLVKQLRQLQTDKQLPLLEGREINDDNLAQSIVACFIHCCYSEEPRLKKVQNAYTKWNIALLARNGVKQAQFAKDFPAYRFKTTWDTLLADKCRNCQQCRHKCPKFDSNYNVQRLIELYLNTPSRQNRALDHDELEKMWDEIAEDVLRSPYAVQVVTKVLAGLPYDKKRTVVGEALFDIFNPIDKDNGGKE